MLALCYIAHHFFFGNNIAASDRVVKIPAIVVIVRNDRTHRALFLSGSSCADHPELDLSPSLSLQRSSFTAIVYESHSLLLRFQAELLTVRNRLRRQLSLSCPLFVGLVRSDHGGIPSGQNPTLALLAWWLVGSERRKSLRSVDVMKYEENSV